MYRLLRRGAQHPLVALILVSADKFWSFWCQFIGVFQVAYTRQFMTPLTAIAAQLCVLRPLPGMSPPCPSDPRARLESLGIWAYGASPGRRVARQRGYWAGSTSARKTDRTRRLVQEQAEDILVPPLLRICLTLYYISLFWLLSPPPEQWSL